jgi:hypothetical protein
MKTKPSATPQTTYPQRRLLIATLFGSCRVADGMRQSMTHGAALNLS